MFRDPSGLASERELSDNQVPKRSAIDKLVGTFEEILAGIGSILSRGGGGDGGFASPEAMAERRQDHEQGKREHTKTETPGIGNPGGGPGVYGNPTSTPHDTKQQQSQGNPTTNNPSFDNAVKEFNNLVKRLPEFTGPLLKDGNILFEKTYPFNRPILVLEQGDDYGNIPSAGIVNTIIDFHVRVIRVPILNDQFATIGYNDKIEISATLSPSSDVGPLRAGSGSSVDLIFNGQTVSNMILTRERLSTHSLISEGSVYLGAASFIVPFTGPYSFQSYQIGVHTYIQQHNGTGWNWATQVNSNIQLK